MPQFIFRLERNCQAVAEMCANVAAWCYSPAANTTFQVAHISSSPIPTSPLRVHDLTEMKAEILGWNFVFAGACPNGQWALQHQTFSCRMQQMLSDNQWSLIITFHESKFVQILNIMTCHCALDIKHNTAHYVRISWSQMSVPGPEIINWMHFIVLHVCKWQLMYP